MRPSITPLLPPGPLQSKRIGPGSPFGPTISPASSRSCINSLPQPAFGEKIRPGVFCLFTASGITGTNIDYMHQRKIARILCVALAAAPLLLTIGCAPTTREATALPAPPRSALRTPQPNRPGKQTDGSVLLPNQWSLRPVGRQIELRDFPVNIAVHPGGRYAAVLHSGYSLHQVSVVDLNSGETVSHASLDQTFYGLEFSRDGKRLFCSGAGKEVVHAFDFQNGNLVNPEELKLRDARLRGVPAGLAVDSTTRHLFVANLW